MFYAVCQGKLFLLNVIFNRDTLENEYYLFSKTERHGLRKVINKYGGISYQKEVNEDDLDFAYELWYQAEYFGHVFEVFSSIDKKLLDRDVIVLKASFNDDMAKLLDFGHYDRGTLIKRLCFDDIDRLIEVKVPILKFKDMEQTEKEIPKDKIAEHINNKLE